MAACRDVVCQKARARRCERVGIGVVVVVNHALQIADVSAALELPDLSSRHRLWCGRSAQPGPKPVCGKDLSSIGQLRQLQAARKRTVEMSDRAQLRVKRQIKRAPKRELMFPVEAVRPREPGGIVVVGRNVDEVLVLYLADE